MVLEVPNVDAFVTEAKKAGVTVVYTVLQTDARTKPNGVVIYSSRLLVTATGLAYPYAISDGSKKPVRVLIRLDRSFGQTLHEVVNQKRQLPEKYRQRVAEEKEKTHARLAAEGFEVRTGKIKA